jgi:hypothetical protein
MNPARGILSQAEIDALVARATAHGGLVSYKHNSDGSTSPYELNITYFDALSNPAAAEPAEIQIKRFLVAHAIMFALAGVPGIYFHSLFGSRNDRAGAAASGIPRASTGRKLPRAGLEAELRTPGSLRAQVFAGLRELLATRREPGVCARSPSGGVELDPRVFALTRERLMARNGFLVPAQRQQHNGPLPPGGAMKAGRHPRAYAVRWERLPA